MDEIRCPMCGKPNPGNLDVCQFCEARLKPLTASLPSDAVPPDGTDGLQAPEPPEPSSDLPDWLDFDTDAKFEEGDDTALSDAAPFDDGDDWLTRLESDPESKDLSPLQPEAEPDVEQHAAADMDFNNFGVPDWMKDIEKTRSSQTLKQSPDTNDGEFPTQLADDDESDPTAGLPEWQSDISSEDEDASLRPAEEIDLPDWLTASEDQPTVRLPEGNEEITRPEWAFDLDGDDAQSELPAIDDDKTEFDSGYVNQETIPIQDIQGDSGLPNWLESEDDGAVESPLTDAESELPDWFSDLGGEETVDGSVRGVTDWLSGGRAEEVETVLSTADDKLADGLSGEEVGETESVLSAVEGELPDWLSDLAGEETAKPNEAVPEETAVPTIAPESRVTGVTDWLSDGSAEEVDSVLSAADDEFIDGLSGEEEGETGSTLPAVEGELPDWLSDLGGEETAEIDESVIPQASAPAFTSDHEDELPDWLSDGGDAEEVESTLPVTEGELPDWLSDLDSEESAELDEAIPAQASTPAFTSDDDEELPDWLSDGGAGEVESSIPTAEGELPDWLSDLGSEETAEFDIAVPIQASTPAFTAEDEEELSDGDAEEVESTLPAAEGELPDWLSDLGGEETAEFDIAVPAQASTPAFTAEDEEELPDWLSDGDAEEVETAIPTAEGKLPDWLSDLGGEETAEFDVTAPIQASTPAFTDEDEEELPDGGDAEEVESTLPVTEGELPDWLSDLGGEETAEFDIAVPTQASTPAFTDEDEEELPDGGDAEEVESTLPVTEGELPDWLSDLDSEESTELDEAIPAQASMPAFTSDNDVELPDGGAGEVESSIPTAEVDLPDWLSDLDDEETAEPKEAAVAKTSVPAFMTDDEELPDWLSDISGEETTGQDDIAETGIPTFASTDELPGWLSEIDGIETELPEETLEEFEPDLHSSAVDESRAVPSWLHETEEYPTGEGPLDDTLEAEPTEAVSMGLEDEFDDDLSGFGQLPEWLSDSSQTDGDQIQEVIEPVDDIAPAELPGWLAAMRPVESPVPDINGIDQSGPLESLGPLAGLYGVLASEPEIAQLKKPPVYSNKLQVTEAQQSHAALLGDLLQTEGKPQPMPLPSLISRQRVFQLILGIILIVIAFIAVMASGEMVAMPSAGVIPSGVEQTYQIVTALSSEDTALVAFDYEPGLVGEMDAASAAVVDNMMEKGVKLVLVSTSPTGPALAERFITDVQGNHQYNSSTQYVNLGYIPGGISGLAAFAQNPSWVAPTTLDGDQAWETEPLKNMQSISDFSLVLLITDNPNTTRAWVEQVNPYLEPVPLVAVVSAQVEPIARTYHNQIDGLISGLTGGAAYEVLGGSNLAREQWDAFNIILIVAVSAILIGAVISVGSTMIAQRKENDGGSA